MIQQTEHLNLDFLFWVANAARKNSKVSLHFGEAGRIIYLARAGVTARFLELQSVGLVR